MKHACPLLLAASTLALLISACSQPADLPAPTLEQQFGTTGRDGGQFVETTAAGDVFVAGELNSRAFIRRYNRSGATVWTRVLSVSGETTGTATQFAVDSKGNTYLNWQACHDIGGDDEVACRNMFSKYNRSGVRQRQESASSLQEAFTIDYGDNFIELEGNMLRKFGPSGTLLWTRTLGGSGLEYRLLDVSRKGSIFVRRSDGATSKHGPSGNLVWRKFALPDGILATGPVDELYFTSVAWPDTNDEGTYLTAHKADGSRRWRRAFDSTAQALIDMETDPDGTLYLVGYLQTFAPEGERQDVFVRRYQPDGAYTLNTIYGEAGLELPTALSVWSVSEFYITGASNGPVNGTNAGFYDGFLMRIGAQGQLVWTR